MAEHRRFVRLLRKILGSVDLKKAKTQLDSERLQAIGADPRRVRVTGNLKFDASLPAPTRDRLHTLLGGSLTFESAVEFSCAAVRLKMKRCVAEGVREYFGKTSALCSFPCASTSRTLPWGRSQMEEMEIFLRR